jgi:hypothetical protein
MLWSLPYFASSCGIALIVVRQYIEQQQTPNQPRDGYAVRTILPALKGEACCVPGQSAASSQAACLGIPS